MFDYLFSKDTRSRRININNNNAMVRKHQRSQKVIFHGAISFDYNHNKQHSVKKNQSQKVSYHVILVMIVIRIIIIILI